MSDVAYLVASTLPILWLGFVLAISFMEAPLKFRAAHTSRLAALSIGQLVYRALARVELVFFLMLVAALWQARWPSEARGWLWAVSAVLIAQQVWLLPRLDRRVTALLAGRELPPDRRMHRLYAAGECLKVFLLPALAWSVMATRTIS